MLPDVPEYILKHIVMPYLHLRPYASCFASSPFLEVVPPSPCPALRDQAENTILGHAGFAAAPRVRDECIRVLLPSPQGSCRLPHRPLLRSPRLLRIFRRRPHE